ncbi:hypothetical protein NDU88_006630 [Pleurodeles waltl]|uniref:Uncharacterized protein n=1 Tax=Pleurodeles waltl TaxID=8319 RepID=A0AAV7QJB0_PLEWA|nr:hypothetical protein NDU88_006630 [Pleurodeles waltl]
MPLYGGRCAVVFRFSPGGASYLATSHVLSGQPFTYEWESSKDVFSQRTLSVMVSFLFLLQLVSLYSVAAVMPPGSYKNTIIKNIYEIFKDINLL